MIISQSERTRREKVATCNDCRWKNEKHDCPWDYMYDEKDIDYAEDCTDFRNVNEKSDEFR